MTTRQAVLFTLLLASACAEAEPDEISIEPLNDHLYVISGATDLIVASVGEDGVLLVDAGYPETVDGVRAALASIGAGDPDILINTHYHHAFANERFSSAKIVAHRKARDRMLRDNVMAGREIPAFPAAAVPEVTFSDSLTIHFNGDEIRLVHFPDAHTDGDIAVFFGESNVVATGDVFVPHLPWTDYDAGGRFEALIPALDGLLARVDDETTLVPGHDHPVGREALVEMRDVVARGVAYVEERLAAGDEPGQIAADPLPTDLAEWEGGVPGSMFLESVARGVETTETSCRYVNGLWYEGGTFVESARNVVDGVFTKQAVDVGCEVDLGGRWVVPGFGDAHRHDLNDPETFEAESAGYIERGVFYVMEQDPIVEIGPDLRAAMERPETVDVRYTQGVVSPSWGFITSLYTMLAGQGRFGERTEIGEIDGREIFVIDSLGDLDAKWDALAARNDAFIKVIVAFSEQFEWRRSESFVADPPGPGATAGIDPGLLREIVRRAHEAGLRVSAHIETAGDFRVAVNAGVDFIAHLPGAWQIGPPTGYEARRAEPWLLSAEDARRAAARGVRVITTIHRAADMPAAVTMAEIHRHNLLLLVSAGVPIVIGSDAEGHVAGEVEYLRSLGVLSARRLLDTLTFTTPRTIFPERRIGRLDAGYEASFVVLEEDPLESIEAIRKISMRVKQGRRLDP